MPDYKVGIVCKPDGTFTQFLWQSSNLQCQADEHEAQDENGNTAAHCQTNYRVTGSLEAIFPLNAELPVPGQTVSLTGLLLPTVSSAGTITGTLKIGSSGSTPIAFKIVGTPSYSQSNSDFLKVSFDVVRYLTNGIPSTT